MTTQLSTIQFYNQTLITFEQDGQYYTAMKPICENIGLDWTAQAQRLKRDEVLNSTMVIITIVAEDGKNREMVCLPLDYLNGWLFGIDVKRVKPEIRELLITYKKECYKALADYWLKGKAERNLQAEQLSVKEDEEALHIIVNLFHSLNGAYDMGEKIRNNAPHIAREIDKELGGYHLYNLNEPTRQTLDKARKYIQAKSERIMFVKGMLSLLEEPKRIAN